MEVFKFSQQIRLALSLVVIPALALSAFIAGGGHSVLASYRGSPHQMLAFGMTAPDGKNDVYVARPNGTGLKRLTYGAFEVCAAWSPDYKRIAYCSSRSGSFQIWAMQADGSHQHEVTRVKGASFTFPDYSPNGKQIAFDGTEPGNKFDHIFVSNADGTHVRSLTTESQGNNDYPAWSPNGKKIAFISDQTGVEEVWVMSPDGSHLRELTNNPVTHDQLPDWSPNGKKIAYEQGDSPHGRIWVMNANGSDTTQLTFGPGDDFGAAWSPDGTRIAFARDFGNGPRPVMIMDANGSHQHILTKRTDHQFVAGW